MVAQTSHAGDSGPVTRAAQSVTQASGGRMASQRNTPPTHDYAHESDKAPNNDRQASAA